MDKQRFDDSEIGISVRISAIPNKVSIKHSGESDAPTNIVFVDISSRRNLESNIGDLGPIIIVGNIPEEKQITYPSLERLARVVEPIMDYGNYRRAILTTTALNTAYICNPFTILRNN